MKNIKTKSAIFFLLVAIFLFGADFAFARGLEIQYPPLPFPDVDPPQVFMDKIAQGLIPSEQALPLYIRYFYFLVLLAVGFVAFGAIVYGGVKYLFSVGNPAKMQDARDQAFAGFLGLIFLLASYLILSTINPQLVVLEVSKEAVVSFVYHAECDEGVCVPKLGPGENQCATNADCGPPAPPQYVEVPLGRLIERVILKSEEARVIAEKVKAESKKLTELTLELKKLTEECKCEYARPNSLGCPSDIPPACYWSGYYENCGCTYGQDCPATECIGGTPPPAPCDVCDRKKIIQKQTEILRQTADLRTLQTQLMFARVNLAGELLKLKMAESLIRDSLYPPISYEVFAGLKDVEVRKLNKWKDVDIAEDPLLGVRDMLADPTPLGNDGSEDPATFYVPEKGNEDLIFILENVSGEGLVPPISPWQPPDGDWQPPPEIPPPPSLEGIVLLDTLSLYQKDPRWADTPIVKSCADTLSSGGCGPTSLAIILQFFEVKVDPDEITLHMEKNVHYDCALGALPPKFEDIAKIYGIDHTAWIANNPPSVYGIIRGHLERGHPLITAGCTIPLGQSQLPRGHKVVIRGIGKGSIFFQDPIDGRTDFSFEEFQTFGCSGFYAFYE